MHHGLFITFEGTDGSGKTTQIFNLEKFLRAKGYITLLLREPGGTRIGEKIRRIVLDNANTGMSGIAEMLLYAAARAQLVDEVIRPSLEAGKCIICDRYIDSSYAYQGFGRGLNPDTIENVNNVAVGGTMPDITFFLDISPEEALKRRLAASGADRIENEKPEFHRRVYEGYKKLAAKYPERIKTIDARQDPDEVFSEIRDSIGRYITDSL
jgi:dTMP kinase